MAILSTLRCRERIPELMDDPALDSLEHHHALAGLARLNDLSGSIGVLWPKISALARKLTRPVRVLDIATGSGDVPAGLLAKARRSGVTIELTGCDISPTAVSLASTNCRGGSFFVHDVVRNPLPTGFDVVTCSLFLHHLSADEATLVLTRMKEAARHSVLVNDLARSRFNYLAVSLACRIVSRSPVVRFDGPASVRSAFTPAEALELAENAGLTGTKVKTHFPCRFLLTWEQCC